jgi:hypothetical protein
MLTPRCKLKFIVLLLTAFIVLLSKSLIVILVVNDESKTPGDSAQRLDDELSSTLGSMYRLVMVISSDTDSILVVYSKITKYIDAHRPRSAIAEIIKQTFDIVLINNNSN